MNPSALPTHPNLNLAEAVVRTLVLYALAEAQLGHAKRIRVVASGHSFAVADDGRGHAIGRTVEGTPYLKFIYGHLEYPFDECEDKPVQLQGLGMSLLNRMCTRLDVAVIKPTATLRLRFESGRLVHREFHELESENTGNEVAGSVDTRLNDCPVDEPSLRAWLETIKATRPSLGLSFNGQELLAPSQPASDC